MTDCTTALPLNFKSKKLIHADFSGGNLSSHGGLLLAAQADSQLELSAALAACADDTRDQTRITHTFEDLFRQRILQIVSGKEDLNDAAFMREDPVLKAACNREPLNENHHLGSAPTLCRLENSTTSQMLSKMASTFIELFLGRFSEPPEEIVLDIDGYADPTHGQQEFAAYHGYYRHHMYHPVVINHADSGFPLVLKLRPGTTHAGKQVTSTLRWLFWRIRRVFPSTRIVLRGDGGFSLPEIMQLCERSGVTYVLGYSRNAVLERKNEFFLEQARLEHVHTGEKVRLFNDTYYMAGSWKEPRRLLMKAEYLLQGPNQRFVVTNDTEQDAQELYDGFYVQRGEASENRIKELKLDLKADRLSCSAFLSNQFRLILHQAAFLILLTIREAAKATTLEKARLGRIRDCLIQVAARVKTSSRRITIAFASTFPHQRVMHLICQRLRC